MVGARCWGPLRWGMLMCGVYKRPGCSPLPSRKPTAKPKNLGMILFSSLLGRPSGKDDLLDDLRVLLPFGGANGMHLLNLYGWVVGGPHSPEENRKLQQKVLGCAASLHGEAALAGGDWNIEPEEFPMPQTCNIFNISPVLATLRKKTFNISPVS